MPKGEIRMISGSEQNAMSRLKNLLRWRPGERALIKRGFNKRVRKAAKAAQTLPDG